MTAAAPARHEAALHGDLYISALDAGTQWAEQLALTVTASAQGGDCCPIGAAVCGVEIGELHDAYAFPSPEIAAQVFGGEVAAWEKIAQAADSATGEPTRSGGVE